MTHEEALAELAQLRLANEELEAAMDLARASRVRAARRADQLESEVAEWVESLEARVMRLEKMQGAK